MSDLKLCSIIESSELSDPLLLEVMLKRFGSALGLARPVTLEVSL